MTWPPIWEETFADPEKATAYKHSLAAEVLALSSARNLTGEQKDTIFKVLVTVDEWASDAMRDLESCPWTPLDRLRHPMPSLKTERERKQWERFRWRLDCHDACYATRDAIVEGDWIDAIDWAMLAGNRMMRDIAATGRARGAALAHGKKRTGHAARLERRDALIVRQAVALRRRNESLTDNNIAARLAGNEVDGISLPSAEAIRKILRTARKLGRFDVSSQD